MSRVACSVHTKTSGDHRASTRCVSRILACALRRDTMAAAAALYVSPLLCTPWTGGANGERLAFLPNGRFLRLPLFLTLFAFFPLSLSHPPPRSVFLSKDSGHYLEENFLFSPATTQRNSTVHVDCWRTGVASVEMGRRWKSGKEARGNKSVQRGRKRNCFVSESTVCVLAWLTPLRSPLLPFSLLDRHTVSPSLALARMGKKIRTFFSGTRRLLSD